MKLSAFCVDFDNVSARYEFVLMGCDFGSGYLTGQVYGLPLMMGKNLTYLYFGFRVSSNKPISLVLLFGENFINLNRIPTQSINLKCEVLFSFIRVFDTAVYV